MDDLLTVSWQDRLVNTLADEGDGQKSALGNERAMLDGKLLRAVLDEVYLPVHISLEIVLAHIELEDEGLSGLAWHERRIQPLDRSDQGIATIIEPTVSR